ncbi:MAG TPA: APC family permease, partial [Verrucomicrobiae bacterium]|nr:APC family permease [Verrucomicrobiae bacterium]
VGGTTGVNAAINVIQIGALVVFSVIAITYRLQHPQGSVGWHLSNGVAVTYNVDQVDVTDDKGKVQDTWADGSLKVAQDANGKDLVGKDGKPVPVIKQQDRQVVADDLDKTKNTDAVLLSGLTALGLSVGDPYPVFQKDDAGKLKLDKDGKAMVDPFKVSYKADEAMTGTAGNVKDPQTFNFHPSGGSVIKPHSFNFIFIQACIAILILVGFESVTAMGEEAKNAKRDIPRAVLLSLLIQGCVCYFFEYFAANYLLHNGYTMPNAAASGAPIGDMMVITGSWLFGSYAAGKAFMLVQAATVFLALIGTTLSCLSTGARVTYAMGRDEEVPSHFGLLHGKNLSPHRAIWALAIISAILGIVTVSVYLGGTTPAALDKHNFWYSFGIFSPETYAKLPNTLVIITLISNFGTFMLYMMTCLIAIVAFKEHHTFSGFKHFFIPVFGLVANLACMLFYLIGPFCVSGMSWHEPYIALGVAAVWGIYGLFYFKSRSAKLGRSVILMEKPA